MGKMFYGLSPFFPSVQSPLVFSFDKSKGRRVETYSSYNTINMCVYMVYRQIIVTESVLPFASAHVYVCVCVCVFVSVHNVFSLSYN